MCVDLAGWTQVYDNRRDFRRRATPFTAYELRGALASGVLHGLLL
jgi:hypothetical protein